MRGNLGVFRQYSPRPLPRRVIEAPPAVPKPSPRISIVTPSFNQARFIPNTIQSVLDQCYPNLEYFVQDGASDDGTVEILNSFGERLTYWESVPDQGQSDALNRAFSRCTGEIMAYLNSDDLLMSGTLAVVADFFHQHPNVDVLYGHRIVIDEEGDEIGRWFLPQHDPKALQYADYIPQETLFWRRSIWDAAGGHIDNMFQFAMDWDLLLRFQSLGACIQRVPLFLAAYRVHSASKTYNFVDDLGMREMQYLRERSLGYIPSHMEIRRRLIMYKLKSIALQQIHAKPWLHPLATLFE